MTYRGHKEDRHWGIAYLLTRAEEEAVVVEHLVGVVKPGVELARVSVAANALTRIFAQNVFLKSS